MLKLAPSILSADFGHLAEDVKKIEVAIGKARQKYIGKKRRSPWNHRNEWLRKNNVI